MRTVTTEDRMFVVSDLHLGNPSSSASSRLVSFLDHALKQRASVCINGDGFDLAQTRFPRLASDTPPVMAGLHRLLHADLRVYYIVGNHDILLEHFLSDFVFTQISPFLNVQSGDHRIRVEHGHVYDPWFSHAPTSYQRATRLAGYLLIAIPDIYRLWDRVGTAVDHRNNRRHGQEGSGDPVGGTTYHRAANDLLQRGFDTVIFGHTHAAETVRMPIGTYINCGNWLRGNTYVDIDQSGATLRSWQH
jgi:UDP-2,3-diacylglucosamine pyrophosphatase LpxH